MIDGFRQQGEVTALSNVRLNANLGYLDEQFIQESMVWPKLNFQRMFLQYRGFLNRILTSIFKLYLQFPFPLIHLQNTSVCPGNEAGC